MKNTTPIAMLLATILTLAFCECTNANITSWPNSGGGSITVSNLAAIGGMTNITTYTMTFIAGQTNPVDVYSSDLGRQVNGRYFWNSTIARYTNSGSTNMLFKSADNIGQWVVGGYTNDPANNLNILFYTGANNLPLPESTSWLYLDGFGSTTASVLIGAIVSTNNLINETHEGIAINTDNPKWGNTQTAFSINNVFGEQMIAYTLVANYLTHNAAPYTFCVPGSQFVPQAVANSGINAGLAAYAWNASCPSNSATDKRTSVGVVFSNGTNCIYGSAFEILGLRMVGYNTTANGGGVLQRGAAYDGKGGWYFGDLTYANHGADIDKLGWFNIAASSDTTRPQLLIESVGAGTYTGVQTNGGFHVIPSLGTVGLMQSGKALESIVTSAASVTNKLINTNLIAGRQYVNNYGSVIQVASVSVLATTASVLGFSQGAIMVPGVATNYSPPAVSAVAGFVGTVTNTIPLILVPPGATYFVTNNSVGAGDTTAFIGGQIYIF